MGPDPDDDLAAWLAACDDDLAAGRSPAARPGAAGDELAWLRVVREALGGPPPAAADTAAGPTAVDPLPVIAGRYHVLGRVGSGGMGTVYRCRHAVMGHTVAVKVLSDALAADPEGRERFRREARAAAALDHPHVVRAFEAGEDEAGRPFLVMEFADGVTLAERVRRDGPLPVAEACEYAAQAADGLGAAHAAGLVHRDVKPGNLLVTAGGAVKVLDLGLARFTGEEADALTAANAAILGTVDYLAPEQAVDSRRAGPRADVYGLGATLYFLLTGRAPFQGRGTAEKLLAHQVADPEPLRAARPDVPARVAAVVARMMAKDPARRYPDMAAVAADLRGQAPPAGRPWRWAVAAAAAVGVVAVAALRTPPPPAAPPPAPDWFGEVAALPADGRLARVLARLRADNPEYDGGGFEPTVEAGEVVALALPTRKLADLGALRALTGLRSLTLRATADEPGLVADLRPLAGLPLATLKAGRNPVTDLSPVRGLPLAVLSVTGCPVYDLRPLAGTRVEDLDLIGVPATDLSPLRGLPLKRLSAGGSRLRDLSPLAGLPLNALVVHFCPASDLSPVRGLPLTELRVPGTAVTDLSPLAGMGLQVVSVSKTAVADLSPLRGMPLRTLDASYTAVADLGPLAGTPLRSLHLTGSPVRDLGPLAGAPLVSAFLQKTRVADLTPLRAAPLRAVALDYVPARDRALLRAIPTLTTVNDRPAAQVLGD